MSTADYTLMQWFKDTTYNVFVDRYRLTKFDKIFVALYYISVLGGWFAMNTHSILPNYFVDLLIVVPVVTLILYPIGWVFKKRDLINQRAVPDASEPPMDEEGFYEEVQRQSFARSPRYVRNVLLLAALTLGIAAILTLTDYRLPYEGLLLIVYGITAIALGFNLIYSFIYCSVLTYFWHLSQPTMIGTLLIPLPFLGAVIFRVLYGNCMQIYVGIKQMSK